MIRLRVSAILPIVLLAATAVAQDAPVAGNPHGPMSLDCGLCHAEGGWDEVRPSPDFDHAATGFPLEGRHAGARCRDCHRDPRFAFVGTACADCHADIHKGSVGPDCARCHTPAGWVARGDQRIAHDTTSFPLVGAHARVDCEACHTGPVAGNYVGTPTDCYFCHEDDYAATTAPDHATSGFGTDCRECHSAYSSTWGAGDFHHPDSFPLNGGHGGLACDACHVGGYDGVLSDCYSCHQADYESAADPDHLAGGLPTTCSVCHTTTAWEPASYNHDATGFPLTGAHRAADCASCHQSGYAGTPTDCHACHEDDYLSANDPPHVTSGFGTDCAACHGTSAWEPADWDHDSLFPIYRGEHRGEWNSCTDCHTVPTDYTVFECITCHEHNQSEMDSEHRGVSGYQYVSSECLRCHPDGDE